MKWIAILILFIWAAWAEYRFYCMKSFIKNQTKFIQDAKKFYMDLGNILLKRKIQNERQDT